MKMITSIVILFFLSILCLQTQDLNYLEIMNKINKDSLYSYIAELSGEKQCLIDGELITLDRLNRNGNESATKYLFQKLEEFGYQPQILKCENNTTNVENVICKNSGIKNSDDIIVICAHYDSEAYADFAPGADDNATGCAVVLELARILKNNIQNKTIVFAFWDAEEWGLIGSSCYAKSAFENDLNLVAIINLDMIGYDPNNSNKTKLNTRSSEKDIDLWNNTQHFNNLYSINLNFETINSQHSGSDMISFWNKGFTGISFAEGDYNPYYHTEADRIEFINFDYLLLNAKLVTVLLLETANDGIESSVYDNTNYLNEIIIYPIPASDFITIQFSNKELQLFAEGDKVQIYDVLGIERMSVGTGLDLSSQSSDLSTNTQTIDVSHLPSGVYFIKVGDKIGRFVKN